MNRSHLKRKHSDRHPKIWRLIAVLASLGYGLGTTFPLLAQTTITLINQGEVTYQDGAGNPMGAATNEVTVSYSKDTPEVRAGVKVNPLKITHTETGLVATANTIERGDSLSYYFAVTNTSTVPNPIRIPPRASLLNLEVLGASFYNATEGGNEIVILYDRNGNGVIDLTLDQDGDGQWDAQAPDGTPTPDQGSEVWLYRSALQDYENIDGVNWSTATVFIPVNGTFQVVATVDVPQDIQTGQHMQVFLGNPPPLEDLNNDGLFEVEIEELHDLEHIDDGNIHLEDQDVHTVNILNEGDAENLSIFVNGRRESASFQYITFQETSISVDLGIELDRLGDLTTGETGTYQATITNNGAGTVNQFVFTPTGFESVLGANPAVSLISVVNASGVAVDTSTANLTQQTDGTWLLQGVTIAPGTKVTFNLTGIVPVLEQEYEVVVEVRSPLGIDGVTPVFVDTNPDNNQDEALTPFLVVVKRQPICDGDVPYFEYEVAAVNSANDRLTMTWINPNGEDFVYADLPLSGRVLWPGAVVDENNQPLDWPGWRLENGVWVQGDEWDWVRPNVQVQLDVNPEATIVLGYPPATPNCNTNPPGVVSSEVDLGIDILPPGELTPGTIGGYDINVVNNSSVGVSRFVVVPTGFENVLGVNPQFSITGLRDGSGTALSIAGITVTQQPDGSWLVDGVDFRSGYTVELRVTGTIEPLVADVDFQVAVEVKSPLQPNGTLDFQDTNPANNTDQEPETLQVDLAIDLDVKTDLVIGQPATYGVTLTNNGPGAVNEFLLRLTGFETIFTDFQLRPGTYSVNAKGQLTQADGSVANLPLNLLSLIARDGETSLDLSQVVITIVGNGVTPNGSITISGFTFIPGQVLSLEVNGTLSSVGNIGEQVRVEVDSPTSATGQPVFLDTNDTNDRDADQLVDPLGRLVDCTGQSFNATGFTASLFDTNDGGLTLEGLTNLSVPTAEEIAALNLVINANPNNDNPFTLGADGQYNFLFNASQTIVGRQYVLVINPSASLQSIYSQRRLLLTITNVNTNNGVVNNFGYSVQTLDNLPINLDNANLSVTLPGTGDSTGVQIGNAAQDFLNIISIDSDDESTLVCQAASLSIRKVADRATAAPGDIVIYRITVQNLSNTTVNNVVISDRLPLGFNLLEDSVQAQLGKTAVAVTTSINSGLVQFRVDTPLTGNENPSTNPQLDIIYATEITPDALRGRGRNFALVDGSLSGGLPVTNGPSIATVNLRNGLISDYATLIGRVFVDKNFDGEQQKGEPGVPNAVVYLQNGNRIETDKDGLFSVANILPGWYVGTLDFTSVPGYTIAPNAYLLERESQSRMVRVEPGGMARMNFAVTPVQESVQDPGQESGQEEVKP